MFPPARNERQVRVPRWEQIVSLTISFLLMLVCRVQCTVKYSEYEVAHFVPSPRTRAQKKLPEAGTQVGMIVRHCRTLTTN